MSSLFLFCLQDPTLVTAASDEEEVDPSPPWKRKPAVRSAKFRSVVKPKAAKTAVLTYTSVVYIYIVITTIYIYMTIII